MKDKAAIRAHLRALRQEHAASLPEPMRGLVFRHPPGPLLDLIPDTAIIGLYRATVEEAPTAAYASYFYERGNKIALPRVTSIPEPMGFYVHTDPFGETDLVPGPLGLMQPREDAEAVIPDVILAPLVGFTKHGDRLGQGGGFYDRWLAEHPNTVAIGMAWDCQLVDHLPVEPHDMQLHSVITPTRFFGPFNA